MAKELWKVVNLAFANQRCWCFKVPHLRIFKLHQHLKVVELICEIQGQACLNVGRIV